MLIIRLIVKMCEEKKILLKKIDRLIIEKTSNLLNEIPDVHEISDGIVVRFFTEWDNCKDEKGIKFKKLINHDIPDESTIFFFIPKGTSFSLKKRFYIGCMTCLSGAIDITVNNKNRFLKSYSKICVNSDDVQGKAFENTYLITTSNRLNWSETTLKYVKELGY